MRCALTVLSAIFACAIASSPARADPPTLYPLECVFDGGQHVTTYLELTRPAALADPNFRPALVSQLRFRPANRAASRGVDPGTCAWQDRAFRAGEPNAIEEVFDPAWVTERRDGQTVTYPGQPSTIDPLVGYWVPKVGEAGFRMTCLARTTAMYGYNPALVGGVAPVPMIVEITQCH